MFGKSNDSNVNRRQFLAIAGSVAATSSFASARNETSSQPIPPPPPPTYKVLIDVSNNSPIWTLNGVAGSNNKARHLAANPKETIVWTVKSSSSTSTPPKHSVAIFFEKDTPVRDKSGKLTYAITWSERNEVPDGPMVTVDDDAFGIYKYSVVIHDEVNDASYPDDPKIIVGSGGFEFREKHPDQEHKRDEQE